MWKTLTWTSLKKEYSLIPLLVIIGTTCVCSAAYGIRCLVKNPDIAWVKKEGISNDEYATKQYKLYSPTIDYSKLENRAPKY